MRVSALVLCLAMPSLALAADVVVPHSGRLVDGADQPVEALEGLSMNFALFAQPVPAGVEEAAEWQETYSLKILRGVYSVDLGSRTGGKKALPSTVFSGGASRYLQVSIGTQVLLPRLRVGTMPAAAVSFDLACTDCVKAEALAPAAVTATELAAEAVTSAKIANGTIAFEDFAEALVGTGATTIARGDHLHDERYLRLGANLSCAEGFHAKSIDAATGDVTCAANYTAADAVAAMGAKANGNPLHHDRYTNAEAVAAMGAKANTNALHHDRYTDAEAVAAMGAKANTNALHHDRYTDAEAVAAMGAKASANPLHHDRYTNAEAATAARANLVRSVQFESNDGWADLPEPVLDVLPDGSQGRVHRSVEDGTGCYNWAVSDVVPIDPAKAYEFKLWVRSTESDLSNYFGFYPYDAAGNHVAGAWGNPYFKTNRGDTAEWTEWTGYVLPADVTDANGDGFADRQSDRTNGADWRWPANAKGAVVRFGSCYGNGSNTGQAFFALPSIREVPAEQAMRAGRGFITPSFVNGWSNYGGGYNPAGYYRDSDGVVHLRGLVRNGAGTIFVLPPGYRPEYRELQPVQTNSNTIGRCDILPSGEVTVESGSNTWFSLDGITFKAAGY